MLGLQVMPPMDLLDPGQVPWLRDLPIAKEAGGRRHPFSRHRKIIYNFNRVTVGARNLTIFLAKSFGDLLLRLAADPLPDLLSIIPPDFKMNYV